MREDLFMILFFQRFNWKITLKINYLCERQKEEKSKKKFDLKFNLKTVEDII